MILNKLSTQVGLTGLHRFVVTFVTCLGFLSNLPADAAQGNRKKIAERAIAALDFEMGCVRIEKAVAPSFQIKVKHFMWKKLEDCKLQGDYLGFLNAADDIINDRSDQTTRYKVLPDDNTIYAVCSGLKKVRFRCEFCSDKPLAVLSQNEYWGKFIDCCKRNDIKLDKGTGKVLYRLGNEYSQFVPSGWLSEVRDENGFAILGQDLIYVGMKGSIDKSAHYELKQKTESLCKKVASHEISMSEFRAEMLELDKNTRGKILAQMMAISPKAQEKVRSEIEKVRNEIQAAQSAELSRVRENFANKVVDVSFCIGDHVVVQESLVPYVHTAVVDESLLKLRRFQQARAWERMVELLVADANVRSPSSYDEAWTELQKRRFSVKLLFTIDLLCFGREISSDKITHIVPGSGELEIEISAVGTDSVYVYASENGEDPLQKLIGGSGFDAKQWLRKRELVMMRTGAQGKMPPSIDRDGFRDRSLLLERKPSDGPYAIMLPSDYKVSLDETLLDVLSRNSYKLSRVTDKIKSPKRKVVTREIVGRDSRGKEIKTIDRRTVPNLPQEIKRLDWIFSHPDFIDVYRKYGGTDNPGDLMSEWKNAREHIGDPKLLRENIRRRFKQLYKDCLTLEELKERYEVYDRRAKGEDFKPDQFKKWAIEDQSLYVYTKYSDLLSSLTHYLSDLQKHLWQKVHPKK